MYTSKMPGRARPNYERDRSRLEQIIRQAKVLRAIYLRDNFWPACGTTGGVLLFFAAAIIVPP
ncbi:MAG TPA: hypothetical protein VFB29_12760 [Pseudolabrys sp.]|nr:hypothetical protein [Pseudolabrys sp.]